MTLIFKDSLKVCVRSIFYTCLFIVISGNVFAATLYMGPSENYTNLQAAMAAMSSGDTLIIRDGTYTGSTNVIDQSHRPPSGSSSTYTTIKAENAGSVLFDGENIRNMCYLVGTDQTNHLKYVQLEGLSWTRSSGDLVTTGFSDHIKFIKCSAYETAGTGYMSNGFHASWCSYILFEDCWSYGSSNYNFMADKNADRIIFRRCIAQHDRYPLYYSQAAFAAYDSSNVEFQNCIALDADQTAYYTTTDGSTTPPYIWMFRDTGAGTNDMTSTYFRGCISLNNYSCYGVVGSAADANTNVNFINCVLQWNAWLGNRTRYDGANFDHCVVGNIYSSDSFWGSGIAFEQNSKHITNSIIYNVKTNGIAGGDGQSNYNALYSNGTNYSGATAGTNDKTTINPFSSGALKYLTQIESGSSLKGTASDGGDIGATIIKRIGKTGTLWGETGYNLTQDGTNGQANENLWPFPNENLIRQKMRAYSYNSGNLSGVRGFCADGQTLTKYIWEYLGNTIPTSIYGGASISAPSGVIIQIID